MTKNFVDFYKSKCPFEVLLKFKDQSVNVCLKSVPRVGEVVSVTTNNVNRDIKDLLSSPMIGKKWQITAQLPSNGGASVFKVRKSS